MQIGEIFKNRCRNNRGFTLIEVIAVLVLIAIVAAVVIARGSSTQTIDLATQAEVLKSHMRYAQARAMNTNKVWGVSSEAGAGQSYTVFTWSLATPPARQDMIVLGQDSATITLPPGMTMVVGTMSFDSWGQPYLGDSATGTSIPLNISLSYNSEVKTFTITQNTGFIP